MSQKLVVDDGRSERELLLVGAIVVGRDPACEISHGDPRLSRRHAEFSIAPEGVIVRDLDSRNGIRVNGVPAVRAVLQPGDVVQIAQLKVRFTDEPLESEMHASRRSGIRRSSLTIAAGVEDDRTRVAPSGVLSRPAASRSGAATVALGADRVSEGDERTRVASSARLIPPTSPDLSEMAFRESPLLPPAPAAGYGIQSLVRHSWGRRVLLQGLMLALVVFLIAVVPLTVWQARTFGITPLETWAVLVPPLLASAAAGLLVAALIARTTASRAGRQGR
jgi:hypothetical protein